ncbi:MAG: protein kinase [Planctomycetes bacterium]|nr:protein kinase [Planctomycetota bacterium]
MSDGTSSSTNNCPGLDVLQAFSLGALSDEELQAVAEHASVCERCEAVLATIENKADALVSGLRRHVSLSSSDFEPATDAGATAAPSGDTIVGPLADTAEVRLPVRLLHYELTEKLGDGGMGVVYKASDTRLKRTVAVKLGPGVILRGDEARARFKTEAEAVARLNHPNIVRLYEFGEYRGDPYFAMDYLDGGSLAKVLAAGPLPERKAAELVMTLASAMQHAHDSGIIHRDLKPANVLLNSDGAAKITDFGLAKLLDAEQGCTRSEALIGTVGYISPEAATGKTKDIGPLVDVYGLGAILYEALTGRAPFKSSSKAETLNLVRTQLPKPPSSFQRGISPVLEAICLRCLEKKPKHRFESAQALADDLGRWLRGEPTKTKPPGPLLRIYLWSRRRPALAVGLFLAIVAAVATPIVLHFTDPDLKVVKIERRLANREKVVLIGETGGPKWLRWRNAKERGKSSVSADGVFTVDAFGRGALELVRNPQTDHFRFRAEIKHTTTMKTGRIGIFIGMTEFNLGGDTLLNFGQVTFNDMEDAHFALRLIAPEKRPKQPPLGNPVNLDGHLLIRGPEGGHRYDCNAGMRGEYLFKPAYEPPKFKECPWRKIEIEVSPKSVQVTWEGKDKLKEITPEEWSNNLSHCFKILNERGYEVAALPQILHLRGGVGLFVSNASASFRNVVLEPLDDVPAP